MRGDANSGVADAGRGAEQDDASWAVSVVAAFFGMAYFRCQLLAVSPHCQAFA